MGMLIIFGGLPGVGKTAIARELARQLGAVHLRIDSIEQAIRSAESGEPMNDTGYRVAYAVAEDNLRLGRVVVADSVNPIQLTRDAWLRVAARARVEAVEVEIVCSDARRHRARVEKRRSKIGELRLPTWEEVVRREYEPWPRKHIVIDTAAMTVRESAGQIQAALPKMQGHPAGG